MLYLYSYGNDKSWVFVSIGLGCLFMTCVMHAGPGKKSTRDM